MEENKYYTPSLEEFCIGFEYEITNDGDETNETSWFKTIFGTGIGTHIICSQEYWQQYIEDYINKKCIRVKYLDQQDIEECGGKRYNDINETIDMNHIGRFTLTYIPRTKNMHICYSGDSNIIKFNGTIKNKTELKKLLKQLNIV